LVIFNGPSPSDRLDDYKTECTTSVLDLRNLSLVADCPIRSNLSLW